MFRSKPPYTVEELAKYVERLETLDRLAEKAKRNWIGGGQNQVEQDVYLGYVKTLTVAQETYQRMLQKVNR
jgi:hypothetical protein